MRAFISPLVPVLAMATLVLAACDDTPEQGGSESSAAPPPLEVGVIELQPQRVVLSTELPGRTTAYRMAEVRPQVTGVLQERTFQQGALVEAGDVLYRIDPTPYLAAQDRAEAELKSAQAQLRQAQREWKRTSQLFETKAVSERQRDEALSTLERAQAGVAVAEAALRTARIQLDYTEVKSPISGRTGPTLTTVGALVIANQSQLLSRVVQLDPIYVDVQVPVGKLRQIREAWESGRLDEAGPDQAEVTLRFDDGSAYEHRGRIDVADVTVNPNTSSVTLRATFPNPENELLPGMYVRAWLNEGVRENAILAPQQGITRNSQGQATALVVTADNKAAERRIEITRAIGSFWLVESGLEAGDRLIVSGLQTARPGAPVKPVAAEIPNNPAQPPEDAADQPDRPTP